MNEPKRNISENLSSADCPRSHTTGSRTQGAEVRTGPAISRRGFAASAGSAALWPWVASLPSRSARGSDRVAAAPLGIRDSRQPEREDDSSRRRHTVAPQEREDPPGTQGLLDYTRARYGDRLDREDLERIRDGIVGSMRAAEAIRRVPLANADEPAFVFHAYRRAGP